MPSSLSERYLSRRSPLNWAAFFWRLGFEYFFHAAALFDAAHDDEVPRLRKADAGGMMGRDQHAREHLVGNRIGNELADVAAAEDCLVQPALECVGEGVAIGCVEVGMKQKDLSRADARMGRICVPARKLQSGGGFFCGCQRRFEVRLLCDFLDVLDVGDVVVLVDDEYGIARAGAVP